jgi:hypothetical protein
LLKHNYRFQKLIFMALVFNKFFRKCDHSTRTNPHTLILFLCLNKKEDDNENQNKKREVEIFLYNIILNIYGKKRSLFN